MCPLPMTPCGSACQKELVELRVPSMSAKGANEYALRARTADSHVTYGTLYATRW